MSKRTVQTLILLVDNEFGVLTRIAANIRREGWNIKSLAVAETIDAAVSRLTISVECIDSTLSQVLERIRRLECVRSITVYADSTHFSRELVMATVCGGEALRAGEEAAALGARIIESGGGSVTIELTGMPQEAESLLAALKPYGITNVARSSVVALERPAKEGNGDEKG